MMTIMKNRNTIYYLGDYHPCRKGCNPAFDEYSRRILDFKYLRANCVEYFSPLVSSAIQTLCKETKFDGLLVVPSHTEFSYSSHMLEIVKIMSENFRIPDLHSSLVRVMTVDKLAFGGKRSLISQISSIKVNAASVRDKNILLIDDVVTTGCSMNACRYILEQADVKSVICLTLACTALD